MTNVLPVPVQGTTLIDKDGKATSHFYRWAENVSTVAAQRLTQRTAKAYNWNGSTSNTVLDFDSVPSWVKRVTIMFDGVSLNASARVNVQIGTGGTVQTSGYISQAFYTSYVAPTFSGTGVGSATNASFICDPFGAAGDIRYATYTLVNHSSNTWLFSGLSTISNATVYTGYSAGRVSLSGTLDIIRIVSNTGTAIFDAGSVNIMYE